MNTKLIMALSAVFLAVMGISLTFFPGEIAGLTGMTSVNLFQIVLQLLGALYFAFAMLNWMAKGAIIGGIYNRPISLANLTHFFIGALALIKAIMNDHTLFLPCLDISCRLLNFCNIIRAYIFPASGWRKKQLIHPFRFLVNVSPV